MADWVIGEIKTIHFWTDILFSITVHAPVEPFIAGQFTKLGLEINGKRVQRAYSYVNAPNNPNLEFYLVSIKHGTLSSHLAKLQPSDKIQIAKKPSGFFIINEIPSCDTLWMLATGTALGPYLSILEYGRDLERFKNIVLVHAARYAKDLSYLPKMIKLKKQYAGKLRIQTIVSRETVTGSLIGRIPLLISNNKLETAIGLPINPETSHIMICGNPQMIHDTQQLLKNTRRMTRHLRHQPGHITIENYW